MKKLIILGLFLLPLLNSYSQTRKEQRQQKKLEEYKAAKSLIETRQYEFVANRANPQRGGSVDLTTNSNFLRMNDSISEAAMPYFGRAYNIPYGGPGGIKFKGEVMDYTVKENNKKLNLVVSYRVRGEGDLFDCVLSVHSISGVTLIITSQQRDQITYHGAIDALETD